MPTQEKKNLSKPHGIIAAGGAMLTQEKKKTLLSPAAFSSLGRGFDHTRKKALEKIQVKKYKIVNPQKLITLSITL